MGIVGRNISMADKSVKFCRDVRFGLLIQKKNIAPREIQILTLAGAIKRGRKGGKYIEHMQLFIQYIKFGIQT